MTVVQHLQVANRIAVVGEVMIELAPAGADLLRQGVAGDTYNSAVLLRQLGLAVLYLTALGDDAFSQQIHLQLQQHDLPVHGVLTLPGQQPGLYCIHNSDHGERSFSYWRQHSAARQLFQSVALSQPLLAQIEQCQQLYWSGITLSLMSEAVLAQFLLALQRLRQRGGRVYFDSNYRAALWRDRPGAQPWYQAALLHCDYFFPSLDDIRAIWPGLHELAPALDVLAQLALQHQPAMQIYLRAEAQVCWWSNRQWQHFPLQFCAPVVDTSGAGDAFCAALIAAIQQQLAPAQAVAIAHQAASTLVAYSGAILPAAAWPALKAKLAGLGLSMAVSDA